MSDGRCNREEGERAPDPEGAAVAPREGEVTAPPPFPVIAIDGPAGAGKSTVARQLARRLGFFLLDTGAIYRCLALHAQERGVSWDAGPDLAALALLLPIRFGTGPAQGDSSPAGASADQGASAEADTSAVSAADSEQVFLGEQAVTQAIRSPEISRGASQVSAHPEVRSALLQLQRQLAATGPCVVEGRDIGTVVLPGAPIKLFLTASADVRAQRRFEELSARGVVADRSATLRDQAERDHRDATRATAPLRQAEDALLVDTSALGLEEVLDQIEAICRKRLADWDKSQSH